LIPVAETPTAVERTLPHNLEAERSVLGAILIQNDAYNMAAELVHPEDFYRDAHRRIFDKIIALAERGMAVDFVTLKDELGRAGDLDAVGGPAYIASLVDGVPHATNVEYYAKIVKEKAVLRNLIAAANTILLDAYQADQDAAEILDRAEHSIFQIAEGRIRSGFVSLYDIAQESAETIQKAHEEKQLITGVPTGFGDLDRLTSGLQRGDLIIIAARPSMGKTSLALNIAQHVGTKTGKTVGLFSLEMSREQLFLRMLSSQSQIDGHNLRTGYLRTDDWGRLTEALGVLSEAKVFIDDSPGIGVLEMRAKSRRLAIEHGLHMIIVDYIQLMQGRGRFDNRTQELGAISRALKGLAKELNVPVVVLSQLSRAPESRSDHRPQLSDLRESGALEQDADVVLMIYREDQYNPQADNDSVAEIIVAKQRNGPTDTIKLAFIRERTRFENYDPGVR
jgi:replicative DNA helicase